MGSGCLAAATPGKRRLSLAPALSRPVGGGTGEEGGQGRERVGFRLPGSSDLRETPSVSRTSAEQTCSRRYRRRYRKEGKDVGAGVQAAWQQRLERNAIVSRTSAEQT